MSISKMFKLLGLAVVFAMLVAMLPASMVMAANEVEADPEEGAIGSTFTVIGEDFTVSDSERQARIVFAEDDVAIYPIKSLDEDVLTWETLAWVDLGFEGETGAGDFEIDVEVPDELTDGLDDEDVEPGTYYIYICIATATAGTEVQIRTKTEFTVIGAGEIEIDTDEGPVGTLVEITGESFTEEEDIDIEYHDGSSTISVPIEDGDTETDDDGEFSLYIEIPESTAGEHTITVIVDDLEVETEFTVEPELSVSPQSGQEGDTINVSGTGFGKRDDVEVWFNDNVGVAVETTGSTGSFTASFEVPAGLTASIYDVDADDGDNTAGAKFTVTTAPAPTPDPEPEPAPDPEPEPTTPAPSNTSLSASQTSGDIGATVIIGGAGFKANTIITVKYDDETMATPSTDGTGTFLSPIFKIPASKAGDHTITATDGVNTNQLTFTVESMPPGQPAPLLPEMGVKAKSPVTFDWDDVSDNSTPVTYTLQIATDEDFPEDSVVFTKEKIEISTYALTEKEELDLGGLDTIYYWRIRAVDAADNEGHWAGPGEFYISTGFGGLPDWMLYTLLGIGAVVIFGVGYWLGRRTAFYY